ncbi:SIR2 family NAD-dependent protein deacylase [Microbacterium sp.]|uniref:SIR2 family NAD-dependent protein deacylase n=1 Tax=Microbacterium sp. TaxID=51671 RepID=UPI003A8CEA54
MTGHVFVIQGDTRRFACDAYLYATDRDLRQNGGWMRSAPDAPNRIDTAARAEFQREKTFTLVLNDRPGIDNEPATILTAVPYYRAASEPAFIPRIAEFFRVGTEIARRRGVTATASQRERPLLAIPMFGTGGGGANSIRGRMFRLIYRESQKAAREHDVDVAVVLRDPRDYALAQMIRREKDGAWPELSAKQHAQARELGRLAQDARLVPFMGAGISISAGAPSWSALLNDLAASAGIDPDLTVALKGHDALDQAAYIRQEFERRFRDPRDEQDQFAAAVIRAVNVRRYGIAPPLLAALEAEQAITLNYDRLFEWAAIDGQHPRRVIPGPSAGEERWLLKLHGTVDDPSSIVLTRDDYLGFNSDRAALSSLVKATLMTRHLLFVGFGVTDPHFHEVVHDVRRAVPDRQQRFGTVLTTLENDPVKRRLWERDLDFIHLKTPRLLDIFLDAVLAYGASSRSYLLAHGYDSALSAADRKVSEELRKMVSSIPVEAQTGTAWAAVSGLLTDLGWNTRSASRRSWTALPEGLE